MANIGHLISTRLILYRSYVVQLASVEKMIKKLELFMIASGELLGEINAIGGNRGSCQILGNKSEQQAHESFSCMGNTKALICPAVAQTERLVSFFVRTHSCTCAHKHSPTLTVGLPFLSHTDKNS